MEPEAKVSQIVEHLFRHEAGRIISALTARFGLGHLELFEDAVQDALLKALRQWSYGDVPPKPGAWLMQVARNHVFDALRRDARWRDKGAQLASEQDRRAASETVGILSDDEIGDGELRMIFACCHPALPRESQVALTLKILCGFSVEEIARAFLSSSESIAKRLTRARERLRSEAVPFEIPSGAELAPRLDAVLEVLYLLFNEGYNASHGPEVIRRDLCRESIRLTALLQEHPAGHTPRTQALLALLLLQAARFSARTDAVGEILLLQEQDRRGWDRAMIARGMSHLERARAGEAFTAFHLQAGIAACHCTAPSYEETDWGKILSFYDLLLELNPSPVVALNRAVAVAKVHGPEEGLKTLKQTEGAPTLQKYHLFHAVRGEFHSQLGHTQDAERNFREALRLTSLPAEQHFLQKRLSQLAV